MNLVSSILVLMSISSQVLPGFIKRDGVEHWRVADFEETGEGDEEDEDEETKGEEVRIRWHDEGFEKAKEVGMEAGETRTVSLL